MQNLGQAIVNGLLLGGLYAVVGIGMSVIFGIVRLTNLAHGEFIILASYLSLYLVTVLGIHPLVSLIIVVPVMFILGYIIQGGLVNRLLKRGSEPALLVMFGLSIIIQNALQQVFSPDAQYLRTSLGTASIKIGSISFSTVFILNFLVGIAVIVLLNLYLKRTYTGQAIRATSDDGTAAQLVGVNVKRTFGIAMGISMATAAIAGVLLGMTYNFYPTTGSDYLIISFGVVVIGGMGSVIGTLIAGLIFGLAQLLGANFLGTSVQMLAGYVIILIMLAFRPQGLFRK